MHEQMKRLYQAAKKLKGISGQSELARAINASPQTVKNWEARGVSKQGILEAQRSIGCNAEWLATGRGEMILSNLSEGPNIRGKVPLISWIQAGTWSEIIDNFSKGDAEEWMPCPINHSPGTFVLRVRGESMYNPNGRPSFQDGDLIFVDPERQALHGSLVVVRLDDTIEATFKKLVIEGDRKYLRALNPAWPEPIIQINGHATICGVVIFRGERL